MERLRGQRDDGLVEWDAQTIRVAPRERPLRRKAAMCFDAYPNKDITEAPRYSRTV